MASDAAPPVPVSKTGVADAPGAPRISTPNSRKSNSKSPKRQGSRMASPSSQKSSSPNSKKDKPSPRGPIASTPDWRTWPDIVIIIYGLPVNVQTAEIHQKLCEEGEIAWIDIFQPNGGRTNMAAKVKFEPPPKNPFWESRSLNVHFNWNPRGTKIIALISQDRPKNFWTNMISGKTYPVKINVGLKSLDFGSMIAPMGLNIVKSLQENLSLEFDVRSKKLSTYFSTPRAEQNGGGLRQFKFLIDIPHMKEVLQTSNEGVNALILSLPFPPKYFWKRQDAGSTCTDGDLSWNIKQAWFRANGVAENLEASLAYPVAIQTEVHDPGYIDIGRYTTFRFVLDMADDSTFALQNLLMALQDLNVGVRKCDNLEIQRDAKTMWRYLDHPPILAKGTAMALLEMPTSSVVHLSFEVRYQLEVCVSRGILDEHTICLKFLQTLAKMDAFEATRRLEYLADQGERIYDPMAFFESTDAESYLPIARIPHYCTLIRKAVVTPTTIRFNSPAVETSNRVIRKYSHIQDRFLRIQFVEEAENGRITLNNTQNDDIWKKVYRTLYQGIQIGDRRYEFLAFGSSQLRQCGAYFFCPTNHTSCDDIRQWMGEFSHIKIIAKYAARLGQCFSTTREIRGIHVPTIRTISDIERNGHCFTDGVGVISEFLAKLIIEEMTLDIFDQPSAFQFRMGGCKGVLAMWPHAKGMEVHIRQSQEKFKADFKGLEIIRCAKFTSATLNRQTIIILESLGVPKSVFQNLLMQQIHLYQKAATDNLAAIDLLTKFVDENHTTLILAEFLKAGFKSENLQEPFVMNLLNLWRAWSLKLMKEKARIHVEKGAFVLGCVDETGTLRGHSKATEGSSDKDIQRLPQIFLQLSDPKRYDQTVLVKGVCIVGRNPSLHPGDIRVVQAVDNPRLRHLKDVVVFPSTGDRPIPNMLSGGDLDGDDFFVIWDNNLIPAEWNHVPMDYQGPKPVPLDRDVNVNDLRDFFVNYMKNDVLGLIATAHLGCADELGPKSKQCLHLAELHSNAVDYPKTGEPAFFNSKLQPKQWPHFMEKRNSRKSYKALGVIYDEVVKQSIQFRPGWEHDFDERITKRFQLTNEMLKAARKIKTQYDTSVRRILAQHSVETEFELYSGWAMSKPPIGSDYKRQEDLGHEYDALKHRFREMCYEAAGGQDAEKLDKFVAAMYKVTEEEINIALFEHHRGPLNIGGKIVQPRQLEAKSMPLISFPWIFHWVVIRVALGGRYKPKNSMLASARRKVPPSEAKDAGEQYGISSTSTGGQQNSAVMPDEDISVRLPDGTISHRGETLVSFEADRGEMPEAITTWQGNGVNADAKWDNLGEDEKDISTPGLDDINIIDEGAAVDRLAKLLGLSDDES